jgi:hypothetical protein
VDTEICQVHRIPQQVVWKSPQEIMVNPSKKSGHLLLLVVTLWFSIIQKIFNKILPISNHDFPWQSVNVITRG